jgi:homoserine dehydrogenase
MEDRPGVLAAVTKVLGDHQVSIRSVVQRGIGEASRLVMVTHPVLESRLRTALAEIAELEFVHGIPRTIRVIEEEFV